MSDKDIRLLTFRDAVSTEASGKRTPARTEKVRSGGKTDRQLTDKQ